jgi:phospholipid/cholesterol/gamma-HCH transport system ATP-binding protein
MARYKSNGMHGGGETVIRVRDLEVGFHGVKVLKGINLEISHGEVIGFVGASGGGKSVLTRSIIGLLPKWKGTIEVFGQDIDSISEQERQAIERRWGVLFQGGALFS